MTPLEVAKAWSRNGFFPVPIPAGRKGPVIEGWQNLRLQGDQLAAFFDGAPMNIGILLGEPYGTADVDLDCPEALSVWRTYYIDTALVFGRASKPGSHWFYRCDPPVPSRKYTDPLAKASGEKSTIIELRCLASDGTVGMQTMVPPSTHPDSGETVRCEPGKNKSIPANVDAAVLQGADAKTAAAALLARHWPAAGQGRHETELALAGVLARAGCAPRSKIRSARSRIAAPPRAFPR